MSVNIPTIQVGTGNQTKVITPALLTAIGPDGAPVAIKADANGQILTTGGGTAVSAATETVAGIVELATTAETTTGTDTSRAVTPAGVSAALAAFSPTVPAASTTASGIVELATLAEAQAGTDTVRAVTPSTLPFKIMGPSNTNVWLSTVPSGVDNISISNTLNGFSNQSNVIQIGSTMQGATWNGNKISIGNGSSAGNGYATIIGNSSSGGLATTVIGDYSSAGGDRSISIGKSCRQDGSCPDTVSIASETNINGCSESVNIGRGATFATGSTLAVALGRVAQAVTRGVAVGAYSTSSGAGSFSIGSYSKASTASTGEIGIWNSATGGSLRASGVRVHGKTDNTEGYVAFTAAKVASPTTITAGATGTANEGNEAHGTLMPSGLTFRVNNSNQLLAIYNDAGTIRSLILGTLT